MEKSEMERPPQSVEEQLPKWARILLELEAQVKAGPGEPAGKEGADGDEPR